MRGLFVYFLGLAGAGKFLLYTGRSGHFVLLVFNLINLDNSLLEPLHDAAYDFRPRLFGRIPLVDLIVILYWLLAYYDPPAEDGVMNKGLQNCK